MKSILFFFCCTLVNAAYSQAPSLLTYFKISDDISKISAKITDTSLSVPTAIDILSQNFTTCYASCVTLPIQLISLDAQRTSIQNVRVFWKTTNERNNFGFAIQRSLGNTNSFIEVGFIPAGNSQGIIHKYEFNDANDYQKLSYYRLRQIDIDGNFTYSKTVAVKGYATNELIKVFPNPATTEIILKVYFEGPDNVKINVLDDQGKLVKQSSADFYKGNNIKNINISGLPKSNYLIRIVKSDGTQLTTKFIKH